MALGRTPRVCIAGLDRGSGDIIGSRGGAHVQHPVANEVGVDFHVALGPVAALNSQRLADLHSDATPQTSCTSSKAERRHRPDCPEKKRNCISGYSSMSFFTCR